MIIGTDTKLAADYLREGKLVAIPTETVYGLAANAYNAEAVAAIFKAKNRPFFDPLILHTASLHQIKDFVTEISDTAYLLAENFWAGALTLVLPKKPIVSDLVTSGLPDVAVRIPHHALTLDLLESLDFPLAAPSANPFGYISPTSAAHVATQLGDQVAYILDGGCSRIGIESTIVRIVGDKAIVLRKGGVRIEDLRRILGADKVEVLSHSSSRPEVPGQLKSHYSPKIPFFLCDIPSFLASHEGKKIAVLSFEHFYASAYINIVLSERGDFAEAAARLFSAMRELDVSDADMIVADLLPERDLGIAINDRLRRAAAQG
ncbi:MAG: threonylcarbamoyl-AMP synthase [Bernardetiaceae bacterium]|nr:threonylcarbamoyl-AMP synthase [Bernardetiaceae bacterium]